MLQNVSEAGIKAYGPKWDEAVTALNAYDANTVDFVMGVVAVDPAKAHEIMFQLSKEPEKTLALAKMSLERRIAEITRMADKMATPNPAPAADPKPVTDPAPKAEPAKISAAPAPKPALAPVAAVAQVDPTTTEGNEKMSDAEWEQWYKGKYMKKSA